MKNSGFEAWKARLDYFGKEFPFGPIQKFFNEEGNLHRDNGPAFITPTRITHYINGRKHGIDADIYGSLNYYYENIRIPPHFFTKPESLTIEEVLKHTNAEVRYVGMRIIGMDKVLNDKNTKIIHRDEEKDMVLFQFSGVFESESISYLKVVNSTMEPDGTFKNYYLCVPPTCKTCREAVAWTFKMDEKEYFPTQET
jgi:hypothetical protein